MLLLYVYRIMYNFGQKPQVKKKSFRIFRPKLTENIKWV
jgi:hypothetical protein